MPAQALKSSPSAPKRRIREPALEPPARKIRRVRLVTIFSQTDIQGDYDGFTLVYDGRAVRKLVPWVRGTQLPTRKEMMAFLTEIAEAAQEDARIKEYIERNPFPQRIWVAG